MIRLVLVLLLSLVVSACVTQGGRTSDGKTAAEVNLQLGLGYLQQGRPKLALESLKHAIKLDPKLADAHHYAAESYRQLQQYEHAGDHFKKALKLAPNNAAIKNNYGVYLCDRGQYAEADRYFTEVIDDKYYTATAEALENAGICARKAGDLALAMKRFRQAVDYDARRARSLYQLADLSFLNDDVLNARDFMQRYFSVALKNSQSLWLAIRIEHALGNDEDVREYATALYKNFPDSNEAKEFKSFWANQ